MEKTFRGKTVFITGGSSGIGLALAKELASYGANVTIVARRSDVLEEAHQAILGKARDGVRVQAYIADVTKIDTLTAALEKSAEKAGHPDILINSAGISQPGEFLELSDDIFHQMMDVNYFGTVHAIRAVLPKMIERGSGTIVNISSGLGFINVYGYTAYGASKYAVGGLSDALRMELKPFGIHVSLAYPPDTDTPQLAYDNQFMPYVTKEITKIGGLERPEKVSYEILQGVKQKKDVIPAGGFQGKFFYFVIRLLGHKLFYSYLNRIVSRALKQDSSAKE